MPIWQILKETPKALMLAEITAFLLGISGIFAVFFMAYAIWGG